jgi:nucleotide-binding universal stress UspA family protein
MNNILLLAKVDEKDEFLLHYAANIFKDHETTLHILNVVTVSGDIPLKINGEVLDNCTEFDLSGYEQEAKDHLKTLETYSVNNLKIECYSKVGDGLQIIKNLIDEQQIELVLSGAHVSNTIEDIFSATFASRLMQEVHTPLLTLKCDRGNAPVEHIGILWAFEEQATENLSLVKTLQKSFNSKLTLFKINTASEKHTLVEIKEHMQRFCDNNNLTNCNFQLIEADDELDATQQMVNKYNLDFLTLGHIRRSVAGTFFRGELKTDILNHVMIPIYIY